MADFAVAHLPLGQSDVRTRSVDQRIRILAQQPVVDGLFCCGDRVAFDGGGKSPAIKDRQIQVDEVATLLLECLSARELRAGAEFFFDTQQLVVLGDAIGAAGRAGLDLAGIRRDGEIGDECIFGFPGAV